MEKTRNIIRPQSKLKNALETSISLRGQTHLHELFPKCFCFHSTSFMSTWTLWSNMVHRRNMSTNFFSKPKPCQFQSCFWWAIKLLEGDFIGNMLAVPWDCSKSYSEIISCYKTKEGRCKSKSSRIWGLSIPNQTQQWSNIPWKLKSPAFANIFDCIEYTFRMWRLRFSQNHLHIIDIQCGPDVGGTRKIWFEAFRMGILRNWPTLSPIRIDVL